MSKKNKIDPNEPCRLCALTNSNVTKSLQLFGLASKRLGIVHKIKTYLSVTILENDNLPQTICEKCKRRVLNVHRFATMAHRSQLQLREMFLSEGHKAKSEISNSAETESSTGSQSILHAILTQPTPPLNSTPTPSSPPRFPPPLVPISRLSKRSSHDNLISTSNPSTSLNLVTVKKELSEEIFGDPFVVKEELLSESEEDEYYEKETPDLDQEMLIKSGQMYEEEEEEDLEVTLDPMMFLERDEPIFDNSSKFDQVKRTLEKYNSNISIKRSDPLEASTSQIKESTTPIVTFKLERIISKNPTFTPALPPAVNVTPKPVASMARKHPRTRVSLDKFGGRADPKPYQCAICPRGYYSDIGLQNHLWSHRKILKNSDIGNRDKNSALWKKRKITTSNLVSYNNAMFASPTKYQCPLCTKKIASRSNLRRHLQAHKPNGKHTCEICGRVFKSDVNLSRHMEIHEVSQLSCPDCGRVYPTNSTLKAHMIAHSTERPHQCPHCEKTFKRNQDLKFHLNQHTGERPYKCPFCPKTFASSGNCFSHRKRMHHLETEADRTLDFLDKTVEDNGEEEEGELEEEGEMSSKESEKGDVETEKRTSFKETGGDDIEPAEAIFFEESEENHLEESEEPSSTDRAK